jgi:hypothetical protein
MADFMFRAIYQQRKSDQTTICYEDICGAKEAKKKSVPCQK